MRRKELSSESSEGIERKKEKKRFCAPSSTIVSSILPSFTKFSEGIYKKSPLMSKLPQKFQELYLYSDLLTCQVSTELVVMLFISKIVEILKLPAPPSHDADCLRKLWNFHISITDAILPSFTKIEPKVHYNK